MKGFKVPGELEYIKPEKSTRSHEKGHPGTDINNGRKHRRKGWT